MDCGYNIYTDICQLVYERGEFVEKSQRFVFIPEKKRLLFVVRFLVLTNMRNTREWKRNIHNSTNLAFHDVEAYENGMRGERERERIE